MTTAQPDAPVARFTLPCAFCGTFNRIRADRAADRPRCGECGKPILVDRPVALTADSFHRVIAESELPVLVDFYADWCGPCKMMAPVFDEFAAKHVGKLLVAKVDTDRAQAIAMSHEIRSIPTLARFEGGREVARQAGAMPLPALERFAGVA
jgi:thioredoxin 2